MEAWLKIGNFLDLKENEVMAVLGSGAALWIASLNGHTDVVKLLIENHARVNSRGRNGTTALWAAAQNGHTDIVELLIQNDANVNKKDRDFTAPLWIASQNGHTDIVKLLIENDAEVNHASESREYDSLSRLPQRTDILEIVKLLAENNARIDTPIINGGAPKNYAEVCFL